MGRAATTPRVLLVDDEAELVWSLSKRLSKARPSFTVEVAHDGETAFAMAREKRVDLIVADVRMPGISGVDLVLSLRSLQPELPAIVMTAYKTADVERVTDGVLTSFLEKPFSFDRFLALVDRAIEPNVVGFSGAISVQTLPDVVQLYALSNTTGLLAVRHGDGEGQLWFNSGNVVHARTPNVDGGEAAFFEIMSWSGGEFSMRIGAVPPDHSITSNWQELLMESCRLVDERRRVAQPTAEVGWTLRPPGSTDAIDDAFDAIGMGPPTIVPLSTVSKPQTNPDSAEEVLPMNIKECLAKLNSIDGFVGAALVDGDSGMLLGQEGGAGLNLEVAAAGNTEVVKAKRKTMANLNLKETIEDILITLGKQYHLIRPLRTRGALFFYVALDRQRANLALARIVLADVEKDLSV